MLKTRKRRKKNVSATNLKSFFRDNVQVFAMIFLVERSILSGTKSWNKSWNTAQTDKHTPPPQNK